MFKILSFFPLLMLLCSCVTPRAEFQSKDYSPVKKGVIKYSLSPVLFQSDAVSLRRLDAETKMEDFCGSQRPKILSENKEEKTVGHRTDTSYRQDTTGAAVPGAVTVGGVRAGGMTIGGVRTGGVATGDYTTGNRSQVSRAITKQYQVIHFECK